MKRISKSKTDIWRGYIHNWRRFTANNLVTLITLLLATQILAIEASKNVTQGDFVPKRNLTDRLPITPSQEIKQKPPTPSSSSSVLDAVKPQDFVLGERRNASANENEQEQDLPPNNAPNNSEVNEHDLHVEISGLLRQEILDQFEVISHDLQALSEKIRINESNEKTLDVRSDQTILPHLFRFIRSLPIDESNMCEVEHSVLINFRSELQATLSGTNQAGSNNCPLNYNTDTCEELLKLVLCGYNHLKNGFELATRNSVAIDESRMWQNKLEDYKEKSTKLLDDKITSLSQKYNFQINNLKTDLQSLQNKANLYIKIIKEDGLEVCSYRIVNGDIKGAVDKFKQLKDEFEGLEDVMIRSILRTVYSLDRFENIIYFLKGLPNCSQDRISYPALYDIMKANGHSNSPVLLVLSEALSQCMNPSDLATNVKTQVSSILDSWAYKIRNTDDHGQINTFASIYYTQFRSDLDELMRRAYDNSLSNVEKILQFIRNLPYINDGIIALESLFKRMKNNNHLDSYELVMLAYRIKEFMDMPNYPNAAPANEHFDNIFTKLKYDLPYSVRRLIWNGDVCSVKNRAHREYLYAASDYHQFDSTRGRIFTWIQGVEVIESDWKFETEDNGKTFTMKNTHWGKYMFASGYYTKNDARRWVFYWKDGGKVTQGYWKLKPINNAEYFTIINTTHDEYLYADGDMNEAHDSYRRGVYTWRHGTLHGVMEPEGQWAISC